MADPTLKSALSQMNTLIWQIVIIVLVVAIILIILTYYAKKYNWINKIHNKIDNFELCQDIILFLKPFIEFLKSSNVTSNNYLKDESLTSNTDKIIFKNNPDLEYTYHKSSGIGIFKYKNETPFSIKGRRAIILEYFYNNQDKQNIIYNFYNEWVESIEKESEKVESDDFNKDIIGINSNINNHSDIIEGIIKITNENKFNANEINLYKFEIMLK